MLSVQSLEGLFQLQPQGRVLPGHGECSSNDADIFRCRGKSNFLQCVEVQMEWAKLHWQLDLLVAHSDWILSLMFDCRKHLYCWRNCSSGTTSTISWSLDSLPCLRRFIFRRSSQRSTPQRCFKHW